MLMTGYVTAADAPFIVQARVSQGLRMEPQRGYIACYDGLLETPYLRIHAPYCAHL